MPPTLNMQQLMALDALGEATPEQQAELQHHLAAHPELTEEHAAARRLVAAIDRDQVKESPPPAEAVPPAALARLEEARTRALASATAAKAREAGAGNVTALSSAHSSSHTSPTAPGRGLTSHPPPKQASLTLLAWAALLTLLALPMGWWLLHQVREAPVLATASPALAPRGETGMTAPTLVWENAPGQEYNVWILPAGAHQETTPALFVATGVRSPVPFSTLHPGPGHDDQDAAALKPDTSYLALVCLSGGGRLAGVTVPFHTAPAAIGPPPAPSSAETALALTRQLLDAGRASDALMVLAELPAELRHQPDLTRTEAEVRQVLERKNAP